MSTTIRIKDSVNVRQKDSLNIKDSIRITGRLMIECDTSKGQSSSKARPFYQKASTGLVDVEFWVDSTGQFHYVIHQDRVESRFQEYEKRMVASKDSIRDNYITIPKIEYRLDWKRVLLCLAIGAGIGVILLFLLRLLLGRIGSVPFIGTLRRFFKKTPGN